MINSKYLFEYISLNKHNFRGKPGATFEAISADDLRDKKIPVPSPHVQTAIAEECNSIDAQVEAAKTMLDAARDGIERAIKTMYNSPTPRKRLDQISRLKRGRFSHRPRNDPRFFGGPYPFIQTGDVVKGFASKVPYTQTLNELGLSVSALFEPPVVLVTIAANIGDTALLDYPACFTDSIVGLFPGPDINPRLLELTMRPQKKHLNKIAPQLAQKNINLEILKPLQIPAPSLTDQDKFV